ncbi:MAG: phage/plasmid replication protein [Oscillospiraceae bacterium]
MSNLFKISEQGFGVHTFEIKIVHLNKNDYHTLRDRFKDISIKDKKNKCYTVITEKNSGLRIKLYKNFGNPPYLSVIVNPCKLLGDNDPCHILTCFDKEQLHTKLDQALREYLGNEFGLSCFQLTRIDCTADFVMSSPEVTAEYIRHMSKSIRLNSSADTFGFYKNCEYDEDDDKNPDYEAKHCFRMTNRGFYSLTVYDKLYDLIQKGYFEDVPYPFGRLRFEIALMHRKIRKVSSELGTDDIIELTEYFTRNSESFLKKIISHKIVAGDYYKYSSASKLIEERGISDKKGKRILWLLSMSVKAISYNDLMFMIDNELKSDAKLRAVTELMRKLNINPIALPERIAYNVDILPGIHTMFGIERSCEQ